MLGLYRPHLQLAIRKGRVTAPPLIHAGPVKARLWSLNDVARARKELKTTRNGRKRRARR
jgi:hypothetical protein